MSLNRLRNYLWTSLILLAILLGFVFIRNLIDFPVYYAAGQSLISGRQDLYAADFALGRVMDYRYPPFFLVALLLLWYLPYPVAAYLWYLFSIAQIFALIFVLRIHLQSSPARNKITLLLFFCLAPYFITILHYGNAHLLATFLLFAALYLMLEKKERWSAILLALTITIKLTPALFLLYFAMKQKWRYLAQVGLFLLVINLLPAFYFGLGTNLGLLKDWYQHVVVNQKFHELNGPINLSLKGQLTRYLSPVDYEQRVDGDTRYPQVNIAALSEETIHWLWLWLSLMAVIITFWLLYRNDSNKQSRDTLPEDKQSLMLEYSVLICLMLLIEPLTSKIYFIALLLPVLTLAGIAFSRQTATAKWSKRLLFIIAVLNSALPLIPGRLLQRWFLVLGLDFYVNLSLLVFLALCLYQKFQPVLIGAPQKSSR